MNSDKIYFKNTGEDGCIFLKEKIVIKDSVVLYTIEKNKESKQLGKTHFFGGEEDDSKTNKV